MKKKSDYVLMIGPALDAPGGMSAVVTAYEQAGFFADWNVKYLNSYQRPGVSWQIRQLSRVLPVFLWLLITRQVRLVHVHSASRGSFWRKSLFCIAADFLRVPYVFHLHSGEFPVFFQREAGWFGKRFISRILNRAGAVVALTPSWERELKSIAPKAKIYSIGNFVVCEQRKVLESTPNRNVLFLGRLREKKGIFDLVRAIPRIAEAIPNVKFILAGDGELDAVSQLARTLNVENYIELPGWVEGEDKDRLLNRAEILILPSYFEGLPICILEAMATGVPVISTNVGGIPEVLDNGNCGMLLPPGDVDGIIAATILLMSDVKLCERMRSAARARIEAYYSLRAVTSALSLMYQSILKV